jgi:DNA-binding MarR family transcriptional regulator
MSNAHMEQKSSDARTVRLKFFLARQIETQRRRGKDTKFSKNLYELAPQEAAILASLRWMESYTKNNPLNQQELALLLNTAATVINRQMKTLLKLELAVESHKHVRTGVYYALTDKGRQALNRFANELLATPTVIEPKIKSLIGYDDLVQSSEPIVDEFLTARFSAVKHSRGKRLQDDGL